jgi:peptide/nickel transport system ATP-binding protein
MTGQPPPGDNVVDEGDRASTPTERAPDDKSALERPLETSPEESAGEVEERVQASTTGSISSPTDADEVDLNLDTEQRHAAIEHLAAVEFGERLAKGETLLEVKDLQKWFPIRAGFIRHTVAHVKAVDGLNFSVEKGETFAIVGESGCGKSTTGRAILQLEKPTGGEVIFNHATLGKIDLVQASRKDLKTVRPNMQIIFQDPFSSLDGRMTVGRIIAEPLVINSKLRGRALKDRIAELLTVVGMRPEHASRYPHAFSGGQRQRLGIARALALNPEMIICDEAVSALDVSVQAQVLNLLEKLQTELGLTYIFISHDLSVVEHISDHVAVMYVGKIAEIARTEDLFKRPRHPYSEALLSAVPKPDPKNRSEPKILVGDVPSPANPPGGCYFHTRCPYAQDICSTDLPPLRDLGDGHMAACHFAEELQLEGVTAVAQMEFEVPTRPLPGSPYAQGGRLAGTGSRRGG